jgi:eukaryotic-like serine/threonine-protein kinase
MTGQLVGHYRILEKIGAGGMGEIFRAHDERLGRDVALKLIRPASGDNPDHLRRFEQEARAAAALNHPNIVAIYDVGFEGTTPYIVSELLQGKNLRERLMEGTIPVRDAANYCLQIAHGLAAAHDRYIVHRDLKPENLFLTNDDHIKILDFGVAKLQAPIENDRSIQNLSTVTKSGAVIGTVAYMSPEQLRGKSVDHRSDLFSMGSILYEMLTGCRAFRGETEVDTMTAVLREEPPEINLEQAAIPSGYRDVIRHCLEKDPDNRFQSAKDLAFALQTLSGTSSGTIPLPKKRQKTNVFLPWAIAGLLTLATLLLALVALRPSALPPAYHRVTYESGTIYSARFGPDGQSIYYGAAWNGRPAQLFTTIGNSLQAQPLNFSDATLLAISSTNNLALAMHGAHSGQLETFGGMLAVTPLAGSSPHEIMSDVRWADWDAAGKLAVVHNVDGHSRLEYPLGTVLYQSGGWISHIRFSPHGDRIAFMDHPALWDNRGSVCVTDLSGHVQTLSGPWESEHGVAWRPDGKEIWFSGVDQGNSLNLMAVDLKGKLRMLLTSPEGITLQDVASDGRVLITVNTKRLEMAFTSQGTHDETNLSWHDWNVAKDISHDNQSVLFEDSSAAYGGNYAVALRKLDGSLPILLGEGSAGGLSPDGKWAISVSTGSPQHVTLLPIGPGQPRSVDVGGLQHIHNGWARFLADGEKIAINGNEASHGVRCYALSLAGGKAIPITPEGISCGPSSPDSRYIASDGPNSTIALYPVEAGSPKITIIPSTGKVFNPVRWSSDGSVIYGSHVGEFPPRIYKLQVATGQETMVQELHPAAPAGVVTINPFVVSQDGTHFAYSYSQILSVLYVISGLH